MTTVDTDGTVRCTACTTPLYDSQHRPDRRHRCPQRAGRLAVAVLGAVGLVGIAALTGWLPAPTGWAALVFELVAAAWALSTLPHIHHP